MTSVFHQGKYRQRKDWSTSSIPELVCLEEETGPIAPEIPTSLPPKAPRRSSLAIGLLVGGRGANDPKYKRRSSIATAFLGRQNKNKDASYENAVAVEKRDSKEQNCQNENDGNRPVHNVDTPKFCDFADDEANGSDENDTISSSPKQSLFTSTPDKEKQRRRSSAWQTKLERRRRKNATNPNSMSSIDDNNEFDDSSPNAADSPPIEYNRQKRHSWWNIFVPDIKPRSRRNSSQDIEVLSRSSDNLAVPRPFRSKSRSVDHGLAAPFANLDSLRSTVEGRFDSVERLSRDKLKGSLPAIPTTTYTVGNRDTLTSVAARFDTTPGELTSLNKLNSSFIYPGQQLFVPDKTASSGENINEGASETSIEPAKISPTQRARKPSTEEIQEQEEKERELLDGLRPGSPKPGHIHRIDEPNTTTNKNEDDPIVTQRFLKINVRHITDGQGVVGGVLLVTPNAVMFDPNVSDPLVIEHGPESYGVIAPMELVVNAAIFHDIAHMRVGGGEANNMEKVEIYYPKAPANSSDASHSPGKDSLLIKDETFPELGVGSVEGCDDQDSVCSNNEREGDAFPKAFDRDLVTPVSSQKSQGDSLDTANDMQSNDDDDTKDSIIMLNTTETNKTNDTMAADNSQLGKEFREMRTLEERRRSLLDHHWAVPSKDRSMEDESIEEASDTITSMPSECPTSADGVAKAATSIAAISIDTSNNDSQLLTKQSCHDSGIDIRDPILPVVFNSKKNYSDADIVLSSDWVPPITIAPTDFVDTSSRSQHLMANNSSLSTDSGCAGVVVGRKKASSVSFSVDDNSDGQPLYSTSSDKTADKKNKMLKRLSYPLTGLIEGLTGDAKTGAESTESAPNTGDSSQSVFSKVFSRRSSIGTFIRPNSSDGIQSKPTKAAPPKLDYRSMVSIDDMPELFVSFDKLIPRPARACQDPPLYLRLRMGKPIGKSMSLPSYVMSYGKNKLRPEFWFSVPKNRTDELYRFLNTWVPHLYGELDEEKITQRGFELIQNDTDWMKYGQDKDGQLTSDGEDISELTKESWEVLSMSTDDYRKASLFAAGSFDQDFPLPDLIGTTEILTEEHREKLCGHLPARAEGYSWSLVFSTSQNGFSLNSLYRKLQRIESPILVVIQDTDNNVFGALTSCSLHVSELFYGTGESLLFKFNPNFKVFHWTGENLFFIKGNPESLSIGAGDGRFGLWLDGDLNLGRSQRCSTYANEPLAPQEDFVVKTLECWAFV